MPSLARFWLLPISLTGLTLLAAPSLANWPGDSNTNLPICTAPNDQGDVVSVADGAGGAIIAWDDTRGTSYDVYVQRVDGLGRVQWTPNGVPVCVRDSLQALPMIASDGAGGAIIAWTDQRSGNLDVYVQRVNASGAPQWTANGVALVTATGDQVAYSVVPDGAGGAIVAWHDNRSGNFNIYARRINSAGVPQWAANGVALCTAAGDQFSPQMVSDGAGGAVVTWEDERAGVANDDVYARAINGAGVPQWTADGVALCTAAGEQTMARIVTDGVGGAIVTWDDPRAGNHDVYARRINSAGTAQWTANGVGVCTLASEQYWPTIAADGAGGAIMVWRDDRVGGSTGAVYAQRLSSAGTATWTANGVPVFSNTQNVAGPNPRVISDGAGGAVVAWNDYRTSSSADVYAQRLNASGAPVWTLNGIPISTAAGDQIDAALLPDGSGGAIYAWQDWRTGFGDVYAARTDGTGLLGVPEPIIDAVRDVPNDQGGKVQVLWEPSSIDGGAANPIESYTLWRRIVTTSAMQRAIAERPGDEPGPGHLRIVPDGANATYWEYIVTLPARGAPGYAYMATTGSDSMAGAIPWNVFFVEAKKGTTFYSSRVDSGYSVDNLSPAAPAPFTGNVSSGTTRLHWNPNDETDLFGYRLYRGSSAGFVPGPGNLIAAKSDTGHTDPSVGSYYKLSAVDVHGNESPYALLTPQQTTGVESQPRVTRLSLVGSNPARGSAAFGFTLAQATEIRLVVFDPAGRAVRVLGSGAREEGEHTAHWDGRNESRRALGSGVYLARLTANGRSREVRFVLLR